MRIAHVTLYPPKGEKHVQGSGVAAYSKNLITHTSGVTHEVICEVTSSSEKYNEGHVVVHRVFKRNPLYIFVIHRCLKRINPEVVHIQQELALFGNVITAYLLQWLVLLWRKKTVITIHGIVDPTKIDKKFVKENNSRLPVWLIRLAFRVIYTPLMKWAKRIIVHEAHFKEVAISKYGIAASKIDVVPHGVETLRIIDRELARSALDIPQTAKVVLFMGYATGYKGLDLLIEGFAKFAAVDPRAYLIIGAGKHPKLSRDPTYLAEYQRLMQKAEKMLPRGSYQWQGFIDESEITSYYSASDVSIYPYTTAMSSSGPMSFAIGYEKPFLVSTAFKDIFASHPKILFEQNPTSLAQRLQEFFAEQDTYTTASKVLKQTRTWESVGRKTAKVYQKVEE
jgi:glycosyltransferase involved in cell wall biosynthesis